VKKVLESVLRQYRAVERSDLLPNNKNRLSGEFSTKVDRKMDDNPDGIQLVTD